MNRRLVLVSTSLALALAACSGSGKGVRAPGGTSPQAAPKWSAREHVGKAIELLNQGKREAARRELTDVLRGFPSDPVARSLYNQLDADPKAVLGAQNYPYKVRTGDTMSELAQRFLGDPVQFYILARYNDIQAPGTLAPGQTILIPGRPKPPREEPPKRPGPVVKTPAPTTAAPAPAAAPRDPARATRLRGAALEQMNRGAIDRAVGLLRQAAAADPENALVKRDLDRAMRIRSTVKARR